MGGTNFNGLALVHELVRQGHDVTILNRGRSEADIPDSVARLVGDRRRARHDPGCAGRNRVGRGPRRHRLSPGRRRADGRAVPRRGRPLHLRQLDRHLRGHGASCRSPRSIPTTAASSRTNTASTSSCAKTSSGPPTPSTGSPPPACPSRWCSGPHNMIPAREQMMFRRIVDGRPVLVPGDGQTLLQLGHVDDQAKALAADDGQGGDVWPALQPHRARNSSPATSTWRRLPPRDRPRRRRSPDPAGDDGTPLGR